MLRKDDELFEMKEVHINEGYSNCENMQALSNNLVAYNTIYEPQSDMKEKNVSKKKSSSWQYSTLSIYPDLKLKNSYENGKIGFYHYFSVRSEQRVEITKEPVISIAAVSLDRLVYSTTKAVYIYGYLFYTRSIIYNQPVRNLTYIPSNNLIFGVHYNTADNITSRYRDNPYDRHACYDCNEVVGIELNSNHLFSFKIPLENTQKISNLYSGTDNNSSFLLIKSGSALWRKDLQPSMDYSDEIKPPIKLMGDYKHPIDSIQDNYYLYYDKERQLISIRNINENKLISNIHHTDEIYALALWPGKHSFVTLDLNHIKIWDIQSEKVILQYSNWSNELKQNNRYFSHVLARKKPDICFSHASYSIFIGLCDLGRKIELDVLDYFRQHENWYNSPPTSFLLNSTYQSLLKVVTHQKSAVARNTPLPFSVINIITDYLRGDIIKINDELNLLNKPNVKNLANEFKVFQRKSLSHNEKQNMMVSIINSMCSDDYLRNCWGLTISEPEVLIEEIYNIFHLMESFYYGLEGTVLFYIDAGLLAAKINNTKNLLNLMNILQKGENQYGFLKLLGELRVVGYLDAEPNVDKRFSEFKKLHDSCKTSEAKEFLMTAYTNRWGTFFGDASKGNFLVEDAEALISQINRNNSLTRRAK